MGGVLDVGLDSTLAEIARVPSPIRKAHPPPIDHCHTFKSTRGNSSKRTRAAAGAIVKWSKSQKLGRNTVRNRIKQHQRKLSKQRSKLMFINVTPKMENIRKNFTDEVLKNNVVVFDGGDIGEENLKNTLGTLWKSFRIITGGLEICAPPNAATGVAFQTDADLEPRFVIIPRNEALAINRDGKSLCKALFAIMKTQNNLKRGMSKQVFSVSDSKYCCVGTHARRNAPGVCPRKFKFENGGDIQDWDEVIKSIRRGEHAFHGYLGTNVIRQIREAKKLVSWDTPQTSSGKIGNIFSSVAFGVNVFLPAHKDLDFTYSLIQVHVNSQYDLNDAVVCYFCFPRLGSSSSTEAW